MDCFIANVPIPNPKLPYGKHLSEILTTLNKLHLELSPTGTAWLWCQDFIWNPEPNYKLGSYYQQRYHIMRNKGVSGIRDDGTQYSTEHDKFGGIAEDYVARLLGTESTGVRGGSDGFCDFKFGNQSVDVKWISWEGQNAYLKVNPSKVKSDLYILVQGKEMNILGYATKQEVLDAPAHDWGYGPKKSIRSGELHEFAELVAQTPSLKAGERAYFPDQIGFLLRKSRFFFSKLSCDRDSTRVIFQVTKRHHETSNYVPHTPLDCIDLCNATGKVVVQGWEKLGIREGAIA